MTTLHVVIATEKNAYLARESIYKKYKLPSSGFDVAAWLHGDVANVAMWQCGYVAIRLCGYMATWLYG